MVGGNTKRLKTAVDGRTSNPKVGLLFVLGVAGRGLERGPVCPQPPGGHAGQAGGVWQVGRLQEVPQHLQPAQGKTRHPSVYPCSPVCD